MTLPASEQGRRSLPRAGTELEARHRAQGAMSSKCPSSRAAITATTAGVDEGDQAARVQRPTTFVIQGATFIATSALSLHGGHHFDARRPRWPDRPQQPRRETGPVTPSRLSGTASVGRLGRI